MLQVCHWPNPRIHDSVHGLQFFEELGRERDFDGLPEIRLTIVGMANAVVEPSWYGAIQPTLDGCECQRA
jgi:hypothetical protein